MNSTAISRLTMRPLGEVAHFLRGITFKPEEVVDPGAEDSIVCMRTKNVQSDLDQGDLIAVPPHLVRREELYLRETDILVSTANSWNLVGKCSWVPKLTYKATAGGFISILRADSNIINPRFLYYWFNSDPVQNQVRHCGRQTTNISNLNFERCEALEIPLPRLSEQKRIADILDKADAIRRKRREVVNVFGDLTASIFNDMFSEQLTSTGWANLGDFVEELRYGTSNKSSDEGYTTLRIPNVVRGIIDLGELKTVCVSENEFTNLRLIDGDLLFVRTNGNPDYVGRCAIFQSSQMKAVGLNAAEIIYASYLIRARLKLDLLRPAFLQSYLQTSSGRMNVREKCRTSAGQYNINTKGIGSLKVPKIPIDDQIEFESRISASQPVLTELTAAESESSNLFNSLVQRAFKGEL